MIAHERILFCIVTEPASPTICQGDAPTTGYAEFVSAR
jgi:hypothetical protein